jgi:tetratricopeptide (TPR) repeat protein
MTPEEAQLRSGIETSRRLLLGENAVFLAERLFAAFPSQSSLLAVAQSYNEAGDAGTALRLLRHYAPFTHLPSETAQTPAAFPQQQSHQMPPQGGFAPFTAAPLGGGGGRPPGSAPTATAPGDVIPGSPRWHLTYLMSCLAVRTHQYAEAERALLLLANSAAAARAAGGAAAAAAPALADDEAAVKYWLGLCACHQGEPARGSRPAALFAQSVAAAPAFFISFQQAVRRCDPSVLSDAAGGSGSNPYAAAADDAAAPADAAPAAAATATKAGAAPSDSVDAAARVADASSSVGLRERPSGGGVSGSPSTSALARLLRPFADVYRLVHGTFDCAAALSLLQTGFGPAQRFSGWGLEQQALALFHCGRTKDAIAVFEQLRQREPWRVNTPSMVYYSTCLWHSRQEAALCALAQRLIELVPRSPFTLCVVGNCHSLNRDSRAAAAMFARATSLDPTFAYAHTLRGHELLAVEDVPEAETAFYEALRWDRRHYPAFAGLGELYFRVDREGPARENFRSALKVNGTLPAVLCRLAATYHRAGAAPSELEIALALYRASLERCPSHLPSLQQQASLLVRLGRLHEAHAHITALLAEHADEPSLFVTLGKCLARMGDADGAVRALHRALDLDPRRQASVRVLLDRVAAKKDVDAADQ